MVAFKKKRKGKGIGKMKEELSNFISHIQKGVAQEIKKYKKNIKVCHQPKRVKNGVSVEKNLV